MSEVRRHVDAPPAAVFEVLGDGWLFASWVVGASRIREVDVTWPQVGAKIHHSFGCWPFVIDDTSEVIEFVPSERLRLVARAWPVGEATVELEVQPTGGGSDVLIREDASAGPGRLIPRPLRHLVLVPRNVECLRRLAYLAEGRHHRASSAAGGRP